MLLLRLLSLLIRITNGKEYFFGNELLLIFCITTNYCFTFQAIIGGKKELSPLAYAAVELFHNEKTQGKRKLKRPISLTLLHTDVLFRVPCFDNCAFLFPSERKCARSQAVSLPFGFTLNQWE